MSPDPSRKSARWNDRSWWTDVCCVGNIVVGTGVAALVGGRQIAIFRLWTGEVCAVDQFDPVAKAFVMARGIVGDRNGRPKVAAPVYKQGYYLDTGEAIEAAGEPLACFPCRVRGGRVEVIPEPLVAGPKADGAATGSQAA